jgi:hypothetical protein
MCCATLLSIFVFRQFRQQPKRRRGNPRLTVRQTQSLQQRHPSYICTDSRLEAAERGAWVGFGSLGQVVERDNSLLKIFPSSSGGPVHRAPTSLAPPAALLSVLPASMAVPPSTGSPPPWATVG